MLGQKGIPVVRVKIRQVHSLMPDGGSAARVVQSSYIVKGDENSTCGDFGDGGAATVME